MLIALVSTISAFACVQANIACDLFIGNETYHKSEPDFHNFTESLNYPNKSYPPGIQCVYTYYAGKNRRVRLQFEDFNLAGSAPKCGDYLDVYTDLREVNLDVKTAQLSGRYCGSVAPRVLISLYQVIVLVFHVKPDSPGQKGFKIRYDFLDENKYYAHYSHYLKHGLCGFDLTGEAGQNFTILSPTYPGKYPPNLKCIYKLKGKTSDIRIKLTFRDFDLFYGGQHCPYDALTIRDGPYKNSSVIQRYCGLQQAVDLYSSRQDLYMEFTTVDPPFAEHRGFHIQVVFNNSFVNLDKLIDGDKSMHHLVGTECDVRLMSKGQSNHTIRSPNFPDPYPLNTTCNYYLDGKAGETINEKVNLTFLNFSIASESPKCDDAHLAIIFNEKNGQLLLCAFGDDDDEEECTQQEHKQQDLNSLNTNQEICFQSSSSLSYVSEWQRVHLQFKSNDKPLLNDTWDKQKDEPQGFLANVKFFIDDGIPGNHTGRPNDCSYSYTSTGDNDNGTFNSPRFPETYSLNKTCTYIFTRRANQVIRIYFDEITLSDGETIPKNCNDYVIFYNVFPDWRGQKEIGKYCSTNVTGPIISHKDAIQIKIVFNSDGEAAASGFKANYTFLPYPHPEKRAIPMCNVHFTNQISGYFETPNLTYGGKYHTDWICHWKITVKERHQILLRPIKLKVEGTVGETCRAAVIRIHDNLTDVPRVEWCGEKILPDMKEVLSVNNTIHISFLTVPDKLNRLDGFNFSWTEVRLKQPGEKAEPPCKPPEKFRCNHTKYCIDGKLRCDKLYHHCGDGDNSDKAGCPQDDSNEQLVTILSGIGVGIAVLIILIIVCIVSRKRRRRTKEDRRSMIAQRMALNPGGSSASDDYNLYR